MTRIKHHEKEAFIPEIQEEFNIRKKIYIDGNHFINILEREELYEYDQGIVNDLEQWMNNVPRGENLILQKCQFCP